MGKKISVITLGCDKNTVDSEHMSGVLEAAGYTITEYPEDADVVIVNTCGFIIDAKEQSINTLLNVVEYKKKKPGLKLIAYGCMVQKYWQELAEEIPEIDGFVGSNSVQSLPEVLAEIDSGEKVYRVAKLSKAQDALLPRKLSIKSPSSYLKIAEGCNNNCSYCAIPLMRGSYRSRSIENLLEETKFLADNGVKEISLVAQDITQYGIDIYDQFSLPKLLEELVKIEGLEWIRLLYCYPTFIDERLIQLIKEQEKICKYLDIPLQHADPEILKKMGRRQKPEEVYELIGKIREAIPDIAIRSTFIVGFPGEEEKHFNNLLDFLELVRLDWVGAFKYSREDGTKAASFPKQVPESVKEERFHRLMTLQRQITTMRNGRWLGQKLPVLVEEQLQEGKFLWQGRTQQQAAEVDGVVYFKANRQLKPGEIVNVKVTEVEEYDLIGEI